MKQTILLTYAGDYDMVSKETGEKVSGCSIAYYPWELDGKNLESRYYVGMGPAGVQRAKSSLPMEERAQIQMVPGLYDADFIMTTGSDGKMVLKPTHIEFMQGVNYMPVASTDSYDYKSGAQADVNKGKK